MFLELSKSSHSDFRGTGLKIWQLYFGFGTCPKAHLCTAGAGQRLRREEKLIREKFNGRSQLCPGVLAPLRLRLGRALAGWVPPGPGSPNMITELHSTHHPPKYCDLASPYNFQLEFELFCVLNKVIKMEIP